MTKGYEISIEADETIDGQKVWFIKLDNQLASVAYSKTEVCKCVAMCLEREDD